MNKKLILSNFIGILVIAISTYLLYDAKKINSNIVTFAGGDIISRANPASPLSNYPDAYESQAGAYGIWPEIVLGDQLIPDWGNRALNSILAIEAELGINPSDASILGDRDSIAAFLSILLPSYPTDLNVTNAGQLGYVPAYASSSQYTWTEMSGGGAQPAERFIGAADLRWGTRTGGAHTDTDMIIESEGEMAGCLFSSAPADQRFMYDLINFDEREVASIKVYMWVLIPASGYVSVYVNGNIDRRTLATGVYLEAHRTAQGHAFILSTNVWEWHVLTLDFTDFDINASDGVTPSNTYQYTVRIGSTTGYVGDVDIYYAGIGIVYN